MEKPLPLKGTLMQIWKFYHVFFFINPENFAFLILRLLELYAREFCKFLKKQVNLYLILLFLNVCKLTFHISHVRISQNEKGILK